MAPHTILLIEDDEKECSLFADYIGSMEDFVLVGVADGQASGLTLLVEQHPEIVLLDLRLRQGDGTGFLAALKQLRLPFKPLVIVASGLLTSRTEQAVLRLGADYCIGKDNRDWSPRGVIGILRNFLPLVPSGAQLRANEGAISPDLQEAELRRLISLTLARVGISTGDKANRVLVEMILPVREALKKGAPPPDLKNTVYPLAAKQLGKSPATLERSIRAALKSAWKTIPPDDLRQYYDFPLGTLEDYPSPRDFIFNFTSANFCGCAVASRAPQDKKD